VYQNRRIYSEPLSQPTHILDYMCTGVMLELGKGRFGRIPWTRWSSCKRFRNDRARPNQTTHPPPPPGPQTMWVLGVSSLHSSLDFLTLWSADYTSSRGSEVGDPWEKAWPLVVGPWGAEDDLWEGWKASRQGWGVSTIDRISGRKKHIRLVADRWRDWECRMALRPGPQDPAGNWDRWAGGCERTSLKRTCGMWLIP
jgi:hypothetical protein